MKKKRRRLRTNKGNYFTKLSSAINFLKDYDENLESLKKSKNFYRIIVMLWILNFIFNLCMATVTVNPLPVIITSMLHLGCAGTYEFLLVNSYRKKIKKHISKKADAETFVKEFKEELSKKGYSIDEKSLVKDSKVNKIKNLVNNNKIELPDLKILEKPSENMETYRDMNEYDYVLSKDNNFVDAEEKDHVITLKK